MLLCLIVCLTLLASFFLPSHLSLKHVHVYMYIHVCGDDVWMEVYTACVDDGHVHVCVCIVLLCSVQTVDMAGLQERLRWLMDISIDYSLG